MFQAGITIEEAGQVYLDHMKMLYTDKYRHAPHKIDAYLKAKKSMMRKMMEFFYANDVIYLDKITKGTVTGLVGFLKSGNISNKTVNKYLAEISAINGHIRDKTDYLYSPVSILSFKLKEVKAQRRPLNKDEVLRLLSVSPPHLQNVIICGMCTGFRQENIFGLKWENIDFTNEQIKVITKGTMYQTIPISSLLMELLQKLYKERVGEYVITYKGKPLINSKKAFKTALKKANIELPKWELFHSLRHTVATEMLKSGATIVDVQKALGHSSTSVTEKYLHTSPESQKFAFEVMSNNVLQNLDLTNKNPDIQNRYAKKWQGSSVGSERGNHNPDTIEIALRKIQRHFISSSFD